MFAEVRALSRLFFCIYSQEKKIRATKQYKKKTMLRELTRLEAGNAQNWSPAKLCYSTTLSSFKRRGGGFATLLRCVSAAPGLVPAHGVQEALP